MAALRVTAGRVGSDTAVACGGLADAVGPLSELTAWLSRQWLELSCFYASQQGLFVDLPGGVVKVAGSREVSSTPC
jgi:hypothetical protein